MSATFNELKLFSSAFFFYSTMKSNHNYVVCLTFTVIITVGVINAYIPSFVVQLCTLSDAST